MNSLLPWLLGYLLLGSILGLVALRASSGVTGFILSLLVTLLWPLVPLIGLLIASYVQLIVWLAQWAKRLRNATSTLPQVNKLTLVFFSEKNTWGMYYNKALVTQFVPTSAYFDERLLQFTALVRGFLKGEIEVSINTTPLSDPIPERLQ